MVHYDPHCDVLYFLVREGEEERFEEVAEGVSVELDQQGQLLGVEILNASRLLYATIGPERLTQFARAQVPAVG